MHKLCNFITFDEMNDSESFNVGRVIRLVQLSRWF